MYGEDNGSVICLSQGDKAFNHVEGVECIEAARRFIQEQDTGTCDELACNANTSLLTARNTSSIAFFRTYHLVFNVINAKLLHHFDNTLLLQAATHISRQP